ncbi:MAG: YceI family protein [Proteobacteria bacterium]|nr:YceI family protein [Pseudomonadota bacterium]
MPGNRSRGRAAGVAVACAVIAAVALASNESASPLAVDPAHSSLVASFRQQGVTVDAPFKRFTGSIQYDPARPADTRASLQVDMASLDVGDDDSDAEVRGAAWFDSAHFPQASFQAARVKPGDAHHFAASGELNIKGRARPITVNVSVQPAGRGFAYDGSFDVSRREFGIGDPSWDAVLDDTVHVHFHLVAPGG